MMRKVILSLIFISFESYAGTMYKYKDKDGNILFTNVVDENGKPKGEYREKYNKYIAKKTFLDVANTKKNTAKGKNNELVHFFLVKAGNDFCSNISPMYTLMMATGEPASKMVRRLNMSEDIKKSWIKDLLAIQKYGYDYNGCISMYYGDIPAIETITGYNYYQYMRGLLSSAPETDLLEAKKRVLNQEAEEKEIINEKKESTNEESGSLAY